MMPKQEEPSPEDRHYLETLTWSILLQFRNYEQNEVTHEQPEKKCPVTFSQQGSPVQVATPDQ